LCQERASADLLKGVRICRVLKWWRETLDSIGMTSRGDKHAKTTASLEILRSSSSLWQKCLTSVHETYPQLTMGQVHSVLAYLVFLRHKLEKIGIVAVHHALQKSRPIQNL
jgi:hypothetical protein